jgi:lipopolysaccharide biosynthesis glycosyltransferase
MNSSVTSKYCLATVTTKTFITGTAALIHSFIEKNTWFDGDIVIIADVRKLEQYELDTLHAFKNIKIIDVNPELSENIKILEIEHTELSGKSAQFYSLEAFSLYDYEKVLFCDSDMLFLGSIEPLFTSDKALLCSGDGPHHQGLNRKKHSFNPCIPKSSDEELTNTFNAGFMLIDQSLISQTVYQSLVDMTAKEKWLDSTTPHTDQRILNHYFSGQQSIISPIYNYLLAHQNSIAKVHPLEFSDIKVLHFNGSSKPWLLGPTLYAMNDNTLQHQAFLEWYRQYEKLLSKKHFECLVRNGTLKI